MDARLEPYRVVVSFLGEALGPDYEVVLHDLTSEDGTIVAIVNNHISGRTEGAPLSNMALRFIQERMYEKQDYLAGYQGASQAKGRLRSSTMFIKDNGQLIGMLCINFDAGKYSRIAQELLALCGAHTEPSSTGIGVENFVSSLPDAVHNAIAEVTGSAGLPPDRLTMEEKIRIVESLHHAGIFYMKGAVSEVAAQLGVQQFAYTESLSRTDDGLVAVQDYGDVRRTCSVPKGSVVSFGSVDPNGTLVSISDYLSAQDRVVEEVDRIAIGLGLYSVGLKGSMTRIVSTTASSGVRRNRKVEITDPAKGAGFIIDELEAVR